MSSISGLPAEEDWEERARAFARARLSLYGIQTAAGLLFPLLFWFLGGAAGLERLFEPLSGLRWPEVVSFLLVYYAITSVVFLPFSYYGGFSLQHRFGLSRQNRSGWMSDWTKSTAIGALFFIVGMTAFYLAVPAFPDSWWWILAIALSIIAVLLTFIAPVLLLPIFYRRSPVQDRELSDRITALADKAGARVSQIYTIDMSRRTVAANAALTGIGGTRQVLLGDTMLQQFSRDEVETVVAHELGHHVHGDIWKGLAAEIAGGWIGLALLQYLVRPLFLRTGVGDISVLANLPLLLFLGEVASLVLMPAANALSRHYEAEADAFAARRSKMPEAYSAALYRLAKQNLSELWPPRWVEVLFYTHPAIGRRMAAVSGRWGERERR
jgi:STE24 endopeptidase